MIETDEYGNTTFTGGDINTYRLVALQKALELECKGIQMSQRSVAQIIRKEFGITARRRIDVYQQFCRLHGLTPKPNDQLQKR